MIHKTYELKSNRKYLEKYENLSENFNPHVCNCLSTYTRTYPPVAHAPHMKQINALNRHVTSTHPVVSLMTYTGDDPDQVIRVTTTLPRSVRDLLIKSNVGPIGEEQCQCL